MIKMCFKIYLATDSTLVTLLTSMNGFVLSFILRTAESLVNKLRSLNKNILKFY